MNKARHICKSPNGKLLSLKPPLTTVSFLLRPLLLFFRSFVRMALKILMLATETEHCRRRSTNKVTLLCCVTTGQMLHKNEIRFKGNEILIYYFGNLQSQILPHVMLSKYMFWYGVGSLWVGGSFLEQWSVTISLNY